MPYLLRRKVNSLKKKNAIRKHEVFNSIYGYDFTASRWTYDAKYYLKDGKWWYDWMDKEAMPLNDWMISQMRAIIKENPDKELKDPIDC